MVKSLGMDLPIHRIRAATPDCLASPEQGLWQRLREAFAALGWVSEWLGINPMGLALWLTNDDIERLDNQTEWPRKTGSFVSVSKSLIFLSTPHSVQVMLARDCSHSKQIRNPFHGKHATSHHLRLMKFSTNNTVAKSNRNRSFLLTELN